MTDEQDTERENLVAERDRAKAERDRAIVALREYDAGRMTEREKLVEAMNTAAAEWRRVDAETYDHAGAEWDRAYDALAEYDRTHPPAPTP